MKFPVNYFGSITNWIKANYTHWGENWFLQVGDLMQGDAHRFYIAQDAPLNVPLAKTHVDIYPDLDIYFDGNEFYYYDRTTRIKISAEGKDEIGHYVQFISARTCTEIYVEGALLRNPNWYAKKGGYYVKPISVGDKLGLVYWDGYKNAAGGMITAKSQNDGQSIAIQDDIGGFNWNGTNKQGQTGYHLIAPYGKAGTYQLSTINDNGPFVVSAISTTTGFIEHIWHVI